MAREEIRPTDEGRSEQRETQEEELGPFDLVNGVLRPLTEKEREVSSILWSEQVWAATAVRKNEAPDEDLERYGEEFTRAMAKEVRDLSERKVHERIKESEIPYGAQRIKMRWVLEWKDVLEMPTDKAKARATVRHHEGGLRTAKARSVALGFQEKVTDQACDAPTGSPAGLR